jgi:hypothetical protein
MLRVSDADSQRLVYSLEWGKIWLTLRGDHPADSPGYDTKPLDTAQPQVTTIASMIPALRGYRVLDPGITGGSTGSSNGSSKSAKGV